MNSIPVWIGDRQDYVIPEELRNTKFTKRGFVDRRYKSAQLFIDWQESIRAKERELLAWFVQSNFYKEGEA